MRALASASAYLKAAHAAQTASHAPSIPTAARPTAKQGFALASQVGRNALPHQNAAARSAMQGYAAQPRAMLARTIRIVTLVSIVRMGFAPHANQTGTRALQRRNAALARATMGCVRNAHPTGTPAHLPMNAAQAPAQQAHASGQWAMAAARALNVIPATAAYWASALRAPAIRNTAQAAMIAALASARMILWRHAAAILQATNAARIGTAARTHATQPRANASHALRLGATALRTPAAAPESAPGEPAPRAGQPQNPAALIQTAAPGFAQTAHAR